MKAITFVTERRKRQEHALHQPGRRPQEAGRSVCIPEMDRQATVSDWAEHRTSETPEVAKSTPPNSTR